ncbi:hypothetical protein MKK84_09355 [Methylobacterium sp. E-065]|uniref:hypothetical protein n=1 Tax=Methylobacterium sp. E-065 TaxID=2836583 RepID=UPI001FB8E4DD|nr:hypothetical protein [Methylobacterium sp. E-065]MCJ2017624.1 hypothetical protein [Methylobacterium sp. E-065]
MTVAFSKELATYGIKVNAANPGYTATDFNNDTGYRSLKQAAAGSSGWRTKMHPLKLKVSSSSKSEWRGNGRLTPIGRLTLSSPSDVLSKSAGEATTSALTHHLLGSGRSQIHPTQPFKNARRGTGSGRKRNGCFGAKVLEKQTAF